MYVRTYIRIATHVLSLVGKIHTLHSSYLAVTSSMHVYIVRPVVQLTKLMIDLIMTALLGLFDRYDRSVCQSTKK